MLLLLMIGVNAGFVQAEDASQCVTYTDMKGYINDAQIPVYQYHNKPMLTLYQLNYYGFDISWEGATRSFMVKYNPDKPVKTIPSLSHTPHKKDTQYGHVAVCDISASINDHKVPLIVVNGNHMLPLDALKPYGPVVTYTEEHASYFISYDAKDVMIRHDQFRNQLLSELKKTEGLLSMSELDTIETLTFSNFDGMGFQHMSEDMGLLRNLKSVTFNGIKQHTINPGSFSILTACPSIESVSLDNCVVDDYNHLKALPNLKDLAINLYVEQDEPQLFSIISNIPTLESLSVTGARNQTLDMSLFNKLPLLKTLTIHFINDCELTHIGETHYPELKSLNLYGFSTSSKEPFYAPKIENLNLDFNGESK